MKLIDWLNALPTDLDGVNVRELALKNFNPNFAPFHANRISDFRDFEEALCASRDFNTAPEGEQFWYEIARKLRGVKPIDNQIKMEL